MTIGQPNTIWFRCVSCDVSTFCWEFCTFQLFSQFSFWFPPFWSFTMSPTTFFPTVSTLMTILIAIVAVVIKFLYGSLPFLCISIKGCIVLFSLGLGTPLCNELVIGVVLRTMVKRSSKMICLFCNCMFVETEVRTALYEQGRDI